MLDPAVVAAGGKADEVITALENLRCGAASAETAVVAGAA